MGSGLAFLHYIMILQDLTPLVMFPVQISYLFYHFKT